MAAALRSSAPSGERVVVEADIFTDGHDVLAGVLLLPRGRRGGVERDAVVPLVNDRWRAEFTVDPLGRYEYTVAGLGRPLQHLGRDLSKDVEAGQDVHGRPADRRAMLAERHGAAPRQRRARGCGLAGELRRQAAPQADECRAADGRRTGWPC